MWNEEQSRQNFEVVSQKVTPGDISASPLLIHTLRFDAGGDFDHGGGAQFNSPIDPDWLTLSRWVDPPAPTLDFEVFRTQVQPVFLKRRPGKARCYSCHGREGASGTRAMLLQPLSPGATMWNEEQSRQNFEVVSQKVTLGDISASPLLIHTLRFDAGGDFDHGGGAQFNSPIDPDWLTLSRWVMGENAP